MVSPKTTFNNLIDIPSENVRIVTIKDARNRTRIYRWDESDNRVYQRLSSGRSWVEVTEKSIKSSLAKHIKASGTSGRVAHIAKSYISVPLFLNAK